MYSYDRLENLIGLDIHSTSEIRPEWQRLSVDDRVTLVRPGWMRIAAASRCRHPPDRRSPATRPPLPARSSTVAARVFSSCRRRAAPADRDAISPRTAPAVGT